MKKTFAPRRKFNNFNTIYLSDIQRLNINTPYSMPSIQNLFILKSAFKIIYTGYQKFPGLRTDSNISAVITEPSFFEANGRRFILCIKLTFNLLNK